MHTSKHQLVDMSTGEIVPAITWIRRAWKGEQFVMVFQDAFIAMAKDKTLTGETMRVLFHLLGKLNFENFILIQQIDIATELDLKKPNVSRAIKTLVERGIILEGPKVNRSRGYRINHDLGWKGNLKNLRVLRDNIEREERNKQSGR